MTQGSLLNFVLLSWLLLLAQPVAAQRFALTIGNNFGDSDEEALRWAEDDAQRTRTLLTELGDVEEKNATMVLGVDADGLRHALSALRERIVSKNPGADSLLVAYYSGHGDADSLHLAGSRLPLRELEQLLRAIPVATLVTIVDACRTPQNGVRSKGAHHSEPFDVSLSREAGPSGRVMITATGNDEVAQESDNLRSSFFTHHLLSGMRGAADRDADRQVDLDELYRYAYHKTLASSHAHLAAVQHPQLAVELKGEGELVITRLSRSQSELELAPLLQGHVMVVDDKNGQVVAELFKPQHKVMRIALAAGRFRVQLRDGVKAYAGEVALDWGGHALIDRGALHEQDLRDVQVKGRRLDPQPFMVSTAVRAGGATVSSDAWLWAAGARFSYDLARFRTLGDLQMGYGSTSRLGSAHRYVETRFGLGAGPRFALGPFELFTGISAGLLHVHERADGVRALSGSALGAFAAPTLALEIPIVSHLVLALQGELQLAWLRIDGDMAMRTRPYLTLMLGRHL
jgi:hypothetical protein